MGKVIYMVLPLFRPDVSFIIPKCLGPAQTNKFTKSG